MSLFILPFLMLGLLLIAGMQKYLATSKTPLLINSCEVDSQFPKESQAVTDEILGEGKFTYGYERTYWDGCTHGFAVRGDLVCFAVRSRRTSRKADQFTSDVSQSDPKVKAGKEGAFKASVEWLIKHL